MNRTRTSNTQRQSQSKTDILYIFDRQLGASCLDDSGILVGTDEAGRGPLAGPVVAAAVRLNLNDPISGLNDSKKVAPQQRQHLYDQIVSRALAWSVASASVEQIDRMNILAASLHAMKTALEGLAIDWSLVLVDGNQYIRDIPKQKQRPIVHGDACSASIAAASIIAKVTRDQLMMMYHEQYPEYEFDNHKGYATHRHRQRIQALGLCPIHRKSFCHQFAIQTELDFS
ncbi:MAG: ribonuclease HII [Chitinivibrionales bacterium]|nr:ribonuclease HII [Chitinivibrionales bacterium]